MSDSEHTVVAAIDIDYGELARHWQWLLGIGILTALIGCAAILLPLVASLTIELLLGALLLIDGVLQGIHYLRRRARRGYGWRLAGAILSAVTGLLLLLFPIEGVLSLALLIGLFFLAAGIIKGILAFQLKPLGSWGWLLASAIVSLLLGILVLVLWPGAAAWVIGILVGIDLMVAGAALIVLALFARRHTMAE